LFFRASPDEAYPAVELIHNSVSVNERIVFLNSLPVGKRGLTFIARAGDNSHACI
jgi:hypothetical protein